MNHLMRHVDKISVIRSLTGEDLDTMADSEPEMFRHLILHMAPRVGWVVHKAVCQGIDGPCNGEATRRRQSTAYVDKEKNYVTMCDSCFEYTEEGWRQRRDEYYGGCL